MAERQHLEHLPGRVYLLVVAVASLAALGVGIIQLIASRNGGDAVLWGIVVGLATLALIALGVAWEERRAHVHALVRHSLDVHAEAGGHDPAMLAELMRLGAHREIDFLRSHGAAPTDGDD